MTLFINCFRGNTEILFICQDLGGGTCAYNIEKSCGLDVLILYIINNIYLTQICTLSGQ